MANGDNLVLGQLQNSAAPPEEQDRDAAHRQHEQNNGIGPVTAAGRRRGEQHQSDRK